MPGGAPRPDEPGAGRPYPTDHPAKAGRRGSERRRAATGEPGPKRTKRGDTFVCRAWLSSQGKCTKENCTEKHEATLETLQFLNTRFAVGLADAQMAAMAKKG